MKCTTLREANVARTLEWALGESKLGILFRAAELAGEVGELAETLMDADSYPDYGAFHTHLSEELADVNICVDLTAMELDEAPVRGFSIVAKNRANPSLEALAGRLAVASGKACNHLKKMERERRGWAGSRSTSAQVLGELRNLLTIVNHLAASFGIPLDVATRAKFNMTSEKVGMTTRLVAAE